MRKVVAVVGLFVKNNCILTEHRPLTEEHVQDKTCFPAGTSYQNESLEKTLRREMKEELNLTVLQAKPFARWLFKKKPNKVMLYYFLIERWRGKIKVGSGVGKLKWLKFKEIKELHYARDRSIAKKAIKAKKIQ